MFKNEYVLSVDIKKAMSTVVPTFVQYDNATLLFKIYDDGKPYNLTAFTSAEVTHKRPDGVTITGVATLENLSNGEKGVRYTYTGNEMSKVGFVSTSLSVYSSGKKVSIQPFKVEIVPDPNEDSIVSAPEYGILQQLIATVDTSIQGAANLHSIGTFSQSTLYLKNNIVTNNGSSWIALTNTQNNPLPTLPTTQNTWWRLLAQKGADGNGSSVPDASTTTKGIVQLNNTLTSTSTTLALTAAQGKGINDKLDSHTGDANVHVTATNKSDWNAKETTTGSQAKVNTHAATIATTSALGHVRPDGTTITIDNNGVIKAIGGGGGGTGTVSKINNVTPDASGNVTLTAQQVSATPADHLLDGTKKHIEIVDAIPASLQGKGIFFEKSNGSNPNPPSNGGGGGGGTEDLSELGSTPRSTAKSLSERAINILDNGAFAAVGQDDSTAFSNTHSNQVDIPKKNYRTTREVALSNPVHFKGINKPTITNSSTTSEADFSLRADDITLENVKIVGHSIHHSIASNKNNMNNFKMIDSEILSSSMGIHLNSNSPTNIEVSNTKIVSDDYAFLLNYNTVGGRNLMLFNNHLRSNSSDAIELNTPTEHATNRFRQAKIIGNTISTGTSSDYINSGFAIGIANTADVVVVGNISYESRAQALHIEDDQENIVVTGNVFSGCLSDGCRILDREGAMPVIITNNWFSRETTKGGTGIWRVYDQRGSLDANLSNNGIRNFNTGIWLDGYGIASVDNCIIQDCNVALKLGSGAHASGIVHSKNCHTLVESISGGVADGVITKERPVRFLNFVGTPGSKGALLKEFRVTDEGFYSVSNYNKIPLFPAATFLRGEIDVQVSGQYGSTTVMATLTGKRETDETATLEHVAHFEKNSGNVGGGPWFEEVDGMICFCVYISGTMNFNLSYGFKGTYYQDGTVVLDVEEPPIEQPTVPTNPVDPGILLVSDYFDRADSATVGNGWETIMGTYGISNQTLVPTHTNEFGLIVKDIAQSNNISYSAKVRYKLTDGIAFRVVNSSNFFRAWIDGNNFSVIKKINGVDTTLFTTTMSPIVYTVYTFRVDIVDSTIRVYLNNQLMHSFTDTALSTATRMGYIQYLHGSSTNADFDSFEVRGISTNSTPTTGFFSDDFSSTDLSQNWSILQGSFTVTDGYISATDTRNLIVTKQSYATDNISISTNVKVGKSDAIMFRVQDATNFYLAQIEAGVTLTLSRYDNNTKTALASMALLPAIEETTELKVELRGAQIKVFTGGTQRLQETSTQFIDKGQYGLFSWSDNSYYGKFYDFAIEELD